MQRQPFIRGMRDGIPIALGYYAVAFSLGIIAGGARIPCWMGALSSWLTRASAGEYGVYTLVAANAAYSEVIGISLIANLRYLLMSTALTQKFHPKTSLIKRLCVSACVTDEVFGISIAYPGYLAPSYVFGAFLVSTTLWSAGTASGIFAGNILPQNIVSALSVALYGMFIAIIVPPSKHDRSVLLAVIASFVLSGLCSIAPLVSGLGSGTRIILLTMIISAVAAVVRPIKINNHE